MISSETSPDEGLIKAYWLKLRFTDAERQALRSAAASSQEIADFLDLLNSKDDGVHLKRPEFRSRLDALVGASLLAPERPAQIIDAPLRPEERA